MELVKVENEGYAKYQSLLIKRDNIKKEGFIYQVEYYKQFGQLIKEVFELKIEAIRKKKLISKYTSLINRGETIDPTIVDALVDREMTDYYTNLERLTSQVEAAKKGEKISVAELTKIKRLYRKLVKQIHPDLNPTLANDETIKDLWNRIVIAYNVNNLKELQQLDFQVSQYLASLGKDISFEIENLDERIQEVSEEIESLMKEEPYTYKYLLEDIEEVEDKKEELANEAEEYKQYNQQLQKALDELTGAKMVA